MREWISGFGCSLPSIPKAFISKVFTGDVVIILPNLTVANTEWDGQPQTGGGDVLKQLNRTVVGLGDWAGLRDERRWTLCTLGARILLRLLDSQYDTKPKTCVGLADSPHPAPPHTCWTLKRERGETRDVVAMDKWGIRMDIIFPPENNCL